MDTTGVELVKVEKQERDFPRMRYPSVGRPYRSPSFKDYDKKPRLYFSIEGEGLLEHFGNRVARPTTLYRQFLPQVFKQLGLPADTKVHWSRNAGCGMCPCSPGFIFAEDLGRFDVWVTLRGEAAKVAPGNEDEVAVRQAQLVAQI